MEKIRLLPHGIGKSSLKCNKLMWCAEENDPPSQTAQEGKEGHAEINSPHNAAASNCGTLQPATMTPDESPKSAIKGSTNLTRTEDNGNDTTTATNTPSSVVDQDGTDIEDKGDPHPVEMVDKDDKEDKDNNFNDDAQTFPQVNWLNAVHGNTTTMSSIIPQEVDALAI